MIVITPQTKEFVPLIDGLTLEFIEKSFKSFGINKSDVYITPYVKCRTKTETKKSAKQCSEWLEKEYKLFKPRAVFIVGPKSKIANMNSLSSIVPTYCITHSFYELSTNFKTTDISNYMFKTMKEFIDDKICQV